MFNNLLITQMNDLTFLSGVGTLELAAGAMSLVSTKCTDIVVWGKLLSSNVGYPRFTKLVINLVKLPSYVKSVVVGLILSDGWFNFQKQRQVNARLGFQQSLAHFEYFWLVFLLISPFCSSYPTARTGIRAGVRFYSVTFQTRSLPCFTELFKLFYDCNGRKILPPVDILYELLTPVALAHWIMGDGVAHPSGLVIATDSFSVQEVVLLINILYVRYGIESTIKYHRENAPRIYIRARSKHTLRTIVTPYLCPSMLYKLK